MSSAAPIPPPMTHDLIVLFARSNAASSCKNSSARDCARGFTSLSWSGTRALACDAADIGTRAWVGVCDSLGTLGRIAVIPAALCPGDRAGFGCAWGVAAVGALRATEPDAVREVACCNASINCGAETPRMAASICTLRCESAFQPPHSASVRKSSCSKPLACAAGGAGTLTVAATSRCVWPKRSSAASFRVAGMCEGVDVCERV